MMLTQLQDLEEHHNIVANGYDFGAFPGCVNIDLCSNIRHWS